jgi:hypothetical protein
MFFNGNNRRKLTLIAFLVPFLVVFGIGVYKAHRVQIGLEENPLLPVEEVVTVQPPTEIQQPKTKKSTTPRQITKKTTINMEPLETSHIDIDDIVVSETPVIETVSSSEKQDLVHAEQTEKRAPKDSLTSHQRVYRGKVFTKVK